MKLAIRRISLTSLGKFGCFLGAVAAFVPSLLCGLLALGLVNILRHWLEDWEKVSITLLGREIAQFDFVQLLGLTEFLNQLQTIAGASWLVMALIVVALAIVAGALLAAIIVVVGLAYNLLAAMTGGLVVEADTLVPVSGRSPRRDE